MKIRLFNSYCDSFYGCELWDLSCDGLQAMCFTWRNALRLSLVYHVIATLIL